MRQAQHGDERHRGRRFSSPRTWIGGAAAVCVAGAIALAMSPAEASSNVPVQLTLSGIASPDNPTGGAKVGVHPGDKVTLSAHAVPSAGAPSGLSDALNGLLDGVAGLQVKVLSSNLPGLAKNTLLGKVSGCGGTASVGSHSLSKGTYTFTYVVYKITLLHNILGALTGCSRTTVTPTQDQLGTLTKDNVKVTDNAVYTGQIVSATNPPKGTIGIQLPKQSVSVKAGPIHTSVTLPGATVGVNNPLPGLKSTVKSIVNKATGAAGGKKSTSSSKKKSSTSNINYKDPGLTVPERVMPHAVVNGGSGTGFAAPGGDSGRTVGGGYDYNAPLPQVTSTAAAPADPTAKAKPAAKTVDLASKNQLAGTQLPVLLAIVSILALAAVMGTYARLYLMRHRS